MENTGPLRRLPAELRNRIYHLALVHDTAIRMEPPMRKMTRQEILDRQESHLREHGTLLERDTIEARFADEHRGSQFRFVQPAFTRTCRVVRQEALPVFYGSNTFLLQGDPDAAGVAWLRALEQTQRQMLKSLVVPRRHCADWYFEISDYFGVGECEAEGIEISVLEGVVEEVGDGEDGKDLGFIRLMFG